LRQQLTVFMPFAADICAIPDRVPLDAAASARPEPNLPISVIVPVFNEARNLATCLASLRDVGEVLVIDSRSTDATAQIVSSFGAQLFQFHYAGGWPKKRQWALDTLPLTYDWVLLLDADESLTPELSVEIRRAISRPAVDGYYIGLAISFLGRELRHCGASFYKLSLFRKGKGRFECRFADQDSSMCDMEVHEHILLNGRARTLKNKLIHRNVENLDRYIQKHNQYSNWEVRVWNQGCSSDQLAPALFGSQAQRRRWLRKKLFRLPGSSLLLFLYRYIFRLGFLDGRPGLIYCVFQAIQFFHTKAKIYESIIAPSGSNSEVPILVRRTD
jgi:glycosyltransferase involved in cell wall biosynthesis